LPHEIFVIFAVRFPIAVTAENAKIAKKCLIIRGVSLVFFRAFQADRGRSITSIVAEKEFERA